MWRHKKQYGTDYTDMVDFLFYSCLYYLMIHRVYTSKRKKKTYPYCYRLAQATALSCKFTKQDELQGPCVTFFFFWQQVEISNQNKDKLSNKRQHLWTFLPGRWRQSRGWCCRRRLLTIVEVLIQNWSYFWYRHSSHCVTKDAITGSLLFTIQYWLIVNDLALSVTTTLIPGGLPPVRLRFTKCSMSSWMSHCSSDFLTSSYSYAQTHTKQT